MVHKLNLVFSLPVSYYNIFSISYTRQFFGKFKSIIQRWTLFSPIFRVALESLIEQTDHLIKRDPRSDPIFYLFWKAGQPDRIPLSKQMTIKGSDVWRMQKLTKNYPLLLLQLYHFRKHGVKNYHATKWCHVFFSSYCDRLSFSSIAIRRNNNKKTDAFRLVIHVSKDSFFLFWRHKIKLSFKTFLLAILMY